MKQQNHSLKLAEIPFISIQGEQRPVGQLAMFIRLSGCNLHCIDCDTKYSWGIGEDWSINKLVEWVKSQKKADTLIITGGEPLLQREALEKFLMKVMFIENIYIETNGTQEPMKLPIVGYNVSPKIWQVSNGINETILKSFYYNENSIFKFVARNTEDLKEIEKLRVKLGEIDSKRIYIMPEGITDEAVRNHALELIDGIKELGYNFSPRLQIWLYGNIKGV